jgi:hypothetical protein
VVAAKEKAMVASLRIGPSPPIIFLWFDYSKDIATGQGDSPHKNSPLKAGCF